MLNENLLWHPAISPTGRIMREPTFLGCVLGAIVLGIALFILIVAFAVL
jgi:hypothetical protein